MFPRFIINDCPHAGLCYIKHLRQSSPSVAFLIMKMPYLANLIFRKFGIGIAFALSAVTASLMVHVNIVIGLTAKKKVLWINAITNIASMENIKIARNKSAMNFIRIAMGKYVGIGYLKSTIAPWISKPCPKPTGSCFCDISPKAHLGYFKTRTVPIKIPTRFALDVTVSPVGCFGNISFLAATALTKAQGNVRILLHLKSPSKIWGAIGQAVDAALPSFRAHYSADVRGVK